MLSLNECLLFQTGVCTGHILLDLYNYGKVQVGNDQKKVQSEKDYRSKNRGGKKLN